MELKEINFYDLCRLHYIETGASRTADILERLGNGMFEFEDLFPPPDRLDRSGAIIFSPMGKLLKFYSLLEIAFIIKFIPEPQYGDKFWKKVAGNLNLSLIKRYESERYPIVLPQFLLGRIEGRLHLEDEATANRYDEASAMFLSFVSLVSRWQLPDIQIFLRFAISGETDSAQLDALENLVSDKNEFIRHFSADRSGHQQYSDHQLHGFSQVLSVLDDLDRLLEEAGDFPLLQSAMWNYHADLFSLVDARLPRYLVKLARAFRVWISESTPEEEVAINEYVVSVEKLIERLASGAYGSSLSEMLNAPVGAAPVAG